MGIQSPASLPSIAAAASSSAATDPPIEYASDSMAPSAASALILAPISAASRLTPSPLNTAPLREEFGGHTFQPRPRDGCPGGKTREKGRKPMKNHVSYIQ